MVVRLIVGVGVGVGVSSWRMKVHCFNKRFLGSLSAALPPVNLPSSSETHLWYVIPDEVKNKELLNEYMEILSPCEKKILSQIQGDEPKKRTLLARALVRTTIARYQINSITPKSLKFTKNRYGKPEVDWGDASSSSSSPLHFNISHTSSMVACAVTVSSPVGIDVEQKHRTTKHDVLSLARRYFSEHEVRILSAIPDPRLQQQEFIKLWTLKEAYVKALGKGFSGIPFKTFTIGSFPETSEIVVASSDDLAPEQTTKNWRFILLELACSHYVAICTRNTQGSMRFPVNLMVRKTIPFLEDECVSGTDAVVTVSGLTNWL